MGLSNSTRSRRSLRHAAGAALGGAMLALAFPPFAWWPIAFVALVPLLVAVRRETARRAFVLGLVQGVVAFGVLLWWVMRFGEAAWLLLVLLSAAFVGAFAVLVRSAMRQRSVWIRVLGVAGAWTAIEFVRGSWPLGGFTWGSLGVSQVDSIVAPLASVGGVWSISFLVAAVNAILTEMLAGAARTRALVRTAPIVATAMIVPSFIPSPADGGEPYEVASIQLDVTRYAGLPNDEEDLAIARKHTEEHLGLESDPPDLVVWGEGALDPDAWGDVEIQRSVRTAIASVGAPTLIGAVTSDAEGERTSAILFDGMGREVDRYDKVHLVPFGEYVPWRERLGWFEALEQIPVDRVPGDRLEPVSGEGLPTIGAAICFENAFPSMTRELVRGGATLLVVPVNNASYGSSAASAQHLQMSRMRAIETGRWVVNAGISGISATIDPVGRIVTQTDLFETTTLRTTVELLEGRTLYTRVGDVVVWLSFALLGVVSATALRPRRADPSTLPAPLPGYLRRSVVG